MRAVREALGHIGDGVPIVIDPVMVAESGAVLLDDEARAAIVSELLPLATVITPNLPEARVLAGEGEYDDVEELARALHALGPKNVVVTGGHRDEVTDVFFDGDDDHAAAGRAPSRRRGARIGLHALERARRAPRARVQPARGGAGREGDRLRRGAGRPAGDRRGPGPVNALGIAARSPTEVRPLASGAEAPGAA